MSGVEYLACWAVAIGFTAAATGWAFLVQDFGLPVGAEVVLGVAVPLLVVACGLWAVIVRGR